MAMLCAWALCGSLRRRQVVETKEGVYCACAVLGPLHDACTVALTQPRFRYDSDRELICERRGCCSVHTITKTYNLVREPTWRGRGAEKTRSAVGAVRNSATIERGRGATQ